MAVSDRDPQNKTSRDIRSASTIGKKDAGDRRRKGFYSIGLQRSLLMTKIATTITTITMTMTAA